MRSFTQVKRFGSTTRRGEGRERVTPEKYKMTMIQELQWDSAFFKKKIGKLVLKSKKPPKLSGVLARAKKSGFHYLTFKTDSFNMPVIQALESEGFYLTDVGVTLTANPGVGSPVFAGTTRQVKSVRIAETKDIPMLRSMTKGLFLQSRFYHDPFFSRKEADNLYQQWIENSLKGTAADIVFCIDKAGFITCRKSDRTIGEIVLIGVNKNLRGKGFGTLLVTKAMQWFADQGIRKVTVRTQLRNPDAINFYIKLGFLVKEYDLILGNIL